MVMLYSCQDVPQENSEIVIKDGLIFKQGELKPFTGHVKDTVQEKIIEYDALNGMKHGEFKTYFKNGKIEMVGQIKENLNQGKWKYFYQSGQIESVGNFSDDLPDGEWKWFYENGSIKEQGVFVKGSRERIWKAFSIDGTKTEEKIYKQNQIVNEK
jgi:antitoxin component YwqK of YwqJK toxin-antitoxin module